MKQADRGNCEHDWMRIAGMGHITYPIALLVRCRRCGDERTTKRGEDGEWEELTPRITPEKPSAHPTGEPPE